MVLQRWGKAWRLSPHNSSFTPFVFAFPAGITRQHQQRLESHLYHICRSFCDTFFFDICIQFLWQFLMLSLPRLVRLRLWSLSECVCVCVSVWGKQHFVKPVSTKAPSFSLGKPVWHDFEVVLLAFYHTSTSAQHKSRSWRNGKRQQYSIKDMERSDFFRYCCVISPPFSL